MLDISIEFSAIRLSGINHILHPELILYSGLLPVKSLLFTVCRHCFHSPGVTLFRTNTHSTTLSLEINLYVSNKHHDFSPCLWPWVLYFWHLPNISVQTVSDGTDSSKIKIILRKPTCSIVLLFAFFFFFPCKESTIETWTTYWYFLLSIYFLPLSEYIYVDLCCLCLFNVLLLQSLSLPALASASIIPALTIFYIWQWPFLPELFLLVICLPWDGLKVPGSVTLICMTSLISGKHHVQSQPQMYILCSSILVILQSHFPLLPIDGHLHPRLSNFL